MSKYEWDENKNQSNIEKHKIDFNDAKEVFKDEKCKTIKSPKKDCAEERFLTVGKIFKVLIVVIYTIRKQVTRIISARRPNKKEHKLYNN